MECEDGGGGAGAESDGSAWREGLARNNVLGLRVWGDGFGADGDWGHGVGGLAG